MIIPTYNRAATLPRAIATAHGSARSALLALDLRRLLELLNKLV